LLIFLFALIFSVISVAKHDHFQTFAWDLSFFDELIWKMGRGIEPRSSLGGLHVLGDHFQPILYVFAPLYWIKSDVRMLLITHASIASINVLPIYLLALTLLKKKFLAISVSMMYLLFTGYQFAVFDGFHQSVFAPFFIGWLYYFLVTKNNRGFWVAAIGLLATKEEYALLLAAIGPVIIFYFKRVKLGIATIMVGLVSFFLMIYVLIPYFQKGPYAHFGYGELGNTPIDVVTTTLRSPDKTLRLLLTPPIKIRTVLLTFASFSFLPLFVPLHLVPIAQQFAVRFLDTVTIHRWTNLNHYSFPLAPLMSIALIFSLRDVFVKKIELNKLAIYILLCTLLQDLIFHGPINSLLKPSFYQTQAWEYDVQELIARVPNQQTVASQNSLLPHLSQRNRFYLLPEIGDAEYIAVDMSDGPNKYSPLTHQKTEALINTLLASHQYQLIWRQNKSMLLKKTLK